MTNLLAILILSFALAIALHKLVIIQVEDGETRRVRRALDAIANENRRPIVRELSRRASFPRPAK